MFDIGTWESIANALDEEKSFFYKYEKRSFTIDVLDIHCIGKSEQTAHYIFAAFFALLKQYRWITEWSV